MNFPLSCNTCYRLKMTLNDEGTLWKISKDFTDVTVQCGNKLGMLCFSLKYPCCDNWNRANFYFGMHEKDHILQCMSPNVSHHADIELFLPDGGTLGYFEIVSSCNSGFNDSYVLRNIAHEESNVNPDVFNLLQEHIKLRGVFNVLRLWTYRASVEVHRRTALRVLTKRIDEVGLRVQIIKLANLW